MRNHEKSSQRKAFGTLATAFQHFSFAQFLNFSFSQFLILSISSFLLLPSCRQHKEGSKEEAQSFYCLLPDSFRLQPGDVVFRRGGGFTSHVVINADREGQYSHCGIVADSCGTLFIVHAVPGEPDFKGDPDRVKASMPQQFFSTEYTTIGEVLRPADSLVGRRAGEHAWRLYQRHTLFDHDYDDADTTRMYCTELVAYAYRQAGHDVDQGRRHHVNLPILQGECMFPSDIYASDFLTSVIHF